MTNRRVATAIALVMMFALLAWRGWVFLLSSSRALNWPFGLDYGEGIVWQQANMMFTPRAYGPIDGFPAIVFHYPPLYHVTARAVAALGGLDMLFAGRMVSIVSAIATAIMIGVVGARAASPSASRLQRYLAGAGGSLTWFCFFPVIFWARLMRVDMLAELLSVLGFWLALKSFQNRSLVYVAAVCFVGAVFTKQTALAAPAAIFVLMSWLRPRLAMDLTVSCVVLGLAGSALLETSTDYGFLRHILLYNINRIDLAGLRWISFALESHWPLFLGALALAILRSDEMRGRVAGGGWRSVAAEPADVAWLGLLCYFGTTALMLGMIAKSGATLNYLLDNLLVVSALVGGGLAEATRFVLGPSANSNPSARQAIGVFVAPLLVAYQIPASITPVDGRDRGPELAKLSEYVRVADKPIISDDMVALLRNGKPVVWEPAIFTELASKGVWDDKPFIKRIMNNEFSMFITENSRGDTLFTARYDPAIAQAITTAYPALENLGQYTLHLPRSDSPSLPAEK